jgi:NAD(P)-dependent dehydrogenase (short-subunit alcohol dehydrogenase family)
MKLQRGDVAVVTGAASGIGFALADRFASAGMNVVAADIEPGALDAAVERLGERGTGVLGVPTDVSSDEQVEALAAAAVERFGGVHVVCNNAGVTSMADPWAGPLSAWEWVIGVNLMGVVHGIRAFLPHLVLGGRGHIVNTASMAGLFPGLAASYDATKHAVVALTEDLFHAMRDAGLPIGVSVLCPAITAPVIKPHLDRALAEGMTPAAVADVVATGIEEERYWLLTHPDWMPMAIARWDSIAELADPAPVEEIPGMPPRSQLLEEVMAALAVPPDGTA